MTALITYDQARTALSECARIDEVKEVRDKAEALALYARQRDDHEMQAWVAEIHLRACVRIGELSRELETAQGIRTSSEQSDKVTKNEALKVAGISRSTAHDYEQLAGGREAQGQHAAVAALEHYTATAKQAGDVPTMRGLRVAVRKAVSETLGIEPAPPKPRPQPMSSESAMWIDWVGAVRRVAELPADFDAIAAHVAHLHLTDIELTNARAAMRRLPQWLESLESSIIERRSHAHA